MKPHLAVLVLALACSAAAQVATIEVEARSPAIARGSLVESVGIETLGGVFTPLLNAGCTLPCEVTNTFSTAADNQTEISVALLRGTEDLATDNHALGRFVVKGIPPAPRGEPQVAITLRAAGESISLAARELSGAHVELQRESE